MGNIFLLLGTLCFWLSKATFQSSHFGLFVHSLLWRGGFYKRNGTECVLLKLSVLLCIMSNDTRQTLVINGSLDFSKIIYCCHLRVMVTRVSWPTNVIGPYTEHNIQHLCVQQNRLYPRWVWFSVVVRHRPGSSWIVTVKFLSLVAEF